MRLIDGKSELYTLCPQFVRAAPDPGSFGGCHSSWDLAVPLGSGVSQEAQLTNVPSESSMWIICCAIKCCEPHLAASKMLLEIQFRLFFKYRTPKYKFPVGEDGSFLVNLKVK